MARSCRIFLTAAVAAIVAHGAAAQTAPAGPPLPGSVDPGRVQERLQPETAPRPITNTPTPEIPENIQPADAAQTRFELHRIVVEESTVYQPEQMAPLYAPLLGRSVSLADIYRVADALTAKYRSEGYILSRVVVPAQRISDGEVHIRAVEGFVQDVIIEGRSDPTIIAYGAIAKRSRPLRAADLERALLLIHDLPGVVARGVLSPAPGVTGGSNLTIVVEQKRASVFASLDNHGTGFIGPLQLFSQVAVNGVRGVSDQLSMRFATTPKDSSQLLYFEFGYAMPIGSSGTIVSLSGGWNSSRPGGVLQSDVLRTAADGESFGLRVSQPLIRSRDENLIIEAGLDLRNSSIDQRALPSETLLVSSYADRLREARLGVSYDRIDGWRGRDFVHVQLIQGLPILNASPNGRLSGTSRPGGLSTFTRGAIDASRLQSLDAVTPGLDLLASLSGGWSFGQAVLASEEFGVGGAQFGRGYDPSEITGDYGVATKVELQYNFRPGFQGIPGLAQLIEGDNIPSFQLFAFHDFGAVWDQNPNLVGLPDRARSLASVGGGLRANFRDRLLASVEADKPLTRRVAALASDPDPKPWRIYFSVIGKF